MDNADEINWSVELANSKAEAEVFGDGINNLPDPSLRRNMSIEDRASLIIKPGSHTLTCTSSNPSPEAYVFTGSFLDQKVPLGEIGTDDKGHLIVLGGFGKSDSAIDPKTGKKYPLGITSHGGNFADNDWWYDDVSDGPVSASVRLKGSNDYINASPAWVICTPPKFAPQIQHVITLYDTLLQVAVEREDLRKQLTPELLPTDTPSFTNDIYPLLLRTINVKWIISTADGMHRRILQILYGANGPYGSIDQRKQIFYRLRIPGTPAYKASVGQDMPKIWSDVYRWDKGEDTNPPYPSITEALTSTQYHILDQWQQDLFKKDWPVGPQVPDTTISPDGLTRAALEKCVGGAFYPGIETSFNVRDTYSFMEPFRLDPTPLNKDALLPGDLTKQMCVPWQADFYDCQTERGKNNMGTLLDWWPAQRPVEVFPSDQPESNPPVSWTRDIIRNDDKIGPMDMINNWYKLGFIIKQDTRYVEIERNELHDT